VIPPPIEDSGGRGLVVGGQWAVGRARVAVLLDSVSRKSSRGKDARARGRRRRRHAGKKKEARVTQLGYLVPYSSELHVRATLTY
jgi:hypothetical protein